MKYILEFEEFLEEGRYWITDAGHSPTFTNSETGEKIQLGRYGVVDQRGRRGKGQIIDQGDDLEALLKKYKLTKDDIVELKNKK